MKVLDLFLKDFLRVTKQINDTAKTNKRVTEGYVASAAGIQLEMVNFVLTEDENAFGSKTSYS